MNVVFKSKREYTAATTDSILCISMLLMKIKTYVSYSQAQKSREHRKNNFVIILYVSVEELWAHFVLDSYRKSLCNEAPCLEITVQRKWCHS